MNKTPDIDITKLIECIFFAEQKIRDRQLKRLEQVLEQIEQGEE